MTTNIDTSLASAPSADLLARLPIELLLRITRHLNTTDLCAVRLTSRTLEQALFHSFSHEFFRRKQFMLSDFSLGALLGIAQHPALSQSLRHVSIGLDKFSPGTVHIFRSPEQAIAFHTATAQQQSLVASGRGVRLLSAAFAQLPNLETVDLRDFNSHTRYRDGAHAPWRSYGVRTVLELMGDADRPSMLATGMDPSFPSTAFAMVVAALAQAGARPRNIEVLLRARGHGLMSSAFYLDDGSAVEVLRGLRRVHLDLQFFQNAGWQSLDHVDARGNRFQPITVAGLPLHAWLAHCPNVEWLRINLQHAEARCGSIFLDAIGAPLPEAYPFLASETASPQKTLPSAPRLRRFELGRTACTPAALWNLLQRLPALENLSLWHVTLQDPTNQDRPSTIWARFLGKLASDPLGAQLKHVSLGNLREDTAAASYGTTYGVMFDGLNMAEHTAEATEAKTMRIWLATRSAVAKTDAPESEEEDEDEEGDEEDEEEEEEEEENNDGDGDGDGDGDANNQNANGTDAVMDDGA
ncbi:hypothetical protein SEUCBS139899_006595 [Sporothrix eucalyptigena]|uniref:F-box domain-containing protein n=1 Tax=Sporothrix eucalyptigena TaxID=1812306 RepID=A0ABP0B2L9_9PEZI